MMTVAIVPEPSKEGVVSYRAISGRQHSVGPTAGAALDALAAGLPDDESGTLFVVQHQRPDRFFSAEQQQRLAYLMSRWRECRDKNGTLSLSEQNELDALSQAELVAATNRTAAVLRDAGR